MNDRPLSIGVLSRDRLQQRRLRSMVEQSGNTMAGSFLLDDVCKDAALQSRITSLLTDAWIVAPESGNSGDAHWLEEEWLASLQGIAIYCDGPVPEVYEADYESWTRRLKTKLHQLAGSVNLAQCAHDSASDVRVLAASTGGPAAVKEFLMALPPALNLGFIYAQHIDAGYEDTLLQVFSQGSHYPAYKVENGSVLRRNALAIIPSDCVTELLPNGTFLVGHQEWSGPYRPSIDSVLASVAQSYGNRSGVIVFTGMGDDGAMGCRLMRKSGGAVWIQAPESCTVDSMPLAAVATACVDFKGTPKALARKLSATFSQHLSNSAFSPVSRAKVIGASHE